MTPWEEEYLRTIGRIESGNRYDAVTGSNVGKYQFGRPERARYAPGQDFRDPNVQERAMRLKLGDDVADFQRRAGRAPEPYELYTAHQQGGAGAEALRNAAPGTPAWQAINRFYPNAGVAQQAIWGNVPGDVRGQFGNVGNVSAGDFLELWRRKFQRFAGGGAPLGVPMGLGAGGVTAPGTTEAPDAPQSPGVTSPGTTQYPEAPAQAAAAPAPVGGGGAAPAMAGGGFLQGLANNPLFLEGLMMLTQGTNYRAGSGANIAHQTQAGRRQEQELQLRREEALRHADQFRQTFGLQQQQFGLSQEEAARHGREFQEQQRLREQDAATRQAQEARTAQTFRQDQETIARQQRTFDEAFPGGVPNPEHPLLKAVPEELRPSLYGLGAAGAMPKLYEYAFGDADAKRKIERELELMTRIGAAVKGGGAPAPAGVPAQAPGAPAGVAPPSPGLPPPPIPSAPVPGRAQTAIPPMPPPTIAPPPAAAPIPQAPPVPQQQQRQSFGPPPAPIYWGGQNYTVPEAEQLASFLDRFGKPTTTLREQIKSATEPEREAQKKYAVEQATELAQKPLIKSQAIEGISGLDELGALAKSIRENKLLPWYFGTKIDWNASPLASGSGLADLDTDVQRLINSQTLQKLITLKQSSPSGATGMGSTNEQEFKTIQNALANLSRRQSPAKAEQSMKDIERFVAKTRSRIINTYEERFGEKFADPTAEAGLEDDPYNLKKKLGIQ